MTVTYGSTAGGGPGATAPTTAGAQTWQGAQRSVAASTITNLGASPSVTVLAADGTGTLGAAPTSFVAGSTGNTVTLTYTAAAGGMSSGAVRVTLPAGWTAPSTTSTAAGYTTASTGTVGVAGQVITVTGVTLAGGGTLTILYGSGAGGGPGATAPTGVGVATWQGEQRSSAGGAFANLGSSPSITITPGPLNNFLVEAAGGGAIGTADGRRPLLRPRHRARRPRQHRHGVQRRRQHGRHELERHPDRRRRHDGHVLERRAGLAQPHPRLHGLDDRHGDRTSGGSQSGTSASFTTNPGHADEHWPGVDHGHGEGRRGAHALGGQLVARTGLPGVPVAALRLAAAAAAPTSAAPPAPPTPSSQPTSARPSASSRPPPRPPTTTRTATSTQTAVVVAGDLTNTSPVSITGTVKVGEVLTRSAAELDARPRLARLPVATLQRRRRRLRRHRRRDRHHLHPRRRRPRPDHPRRRDRQQDRVQQRDLDVHADGGRRPRRPHEHDARSRSPAPPRSAKSSPAPPAAGPRPPTRAPTSGAAATPPAAPAPTSPARPATTYTLVAADLGQTIRVVETASKTAYNNATSTSTQTDRRRGRRPHQHLAGLDHRHGQGRRGAHPLRRRLDTRARLAHLPVATLRRGRRLLRRHRRRDRHHLHPRRRRPRPDHPRRRDRHQDRLQQRHLDLGADRRRRPRRPHQHVARRDHGHRQGRRGADSCPRRPGRPRPTPRPISGGVATPVAGAAPTSPARPAPTYTLVAADLGQTIRVVETATKTAYNNATSTSAQTAVVARRRPHEHVAGLDHRHGKVGEVLTRVRRRLDTRRRTRAPTSGDAATRPAAPAPTSPARPATTYTLVAADLGQTIRVVETATKTAYNNATSTSTQTAVVAAGDLTNTSPVSITGTVKVGEILTRSAGGWTPHPTPAPTSGAAATRPAAAAPTSPARPARPTRSSPPTSDRRSASSRPPSKTAYNNATSTSSQTTVVAAGDLTNTSARLDHRHRQGRRGPHPLRRRLDARPRLPQLPVATLRLRRRQLRRPRRRDRDDLHPRRRRPRPDHPRRRDRHQDRLQQRHLHLGRRRRVVALGDLTNTTPVSITGTTKVGEVAHPLLGELDPGPDSRAYQWRRCDTAGGNCADIAGATGTDYTLVAADLGQTIRVVETASKTAYNDATSTSAQTAVVAVGDFTNTTPVSITGTAKVGELLTRSAASWTPGPDSRTYQWRRCDDAGANCADIAGETGNTYTLVAADLGQTIRVVETASKTAYNNATSTSTQTGRRRHRRPHQHEPRLDHRHRQGRRDRSPARLRAGRPGLTRAPTSGAAATAAAATAPTSPARPARPTRSSPPTSARRSASSRPPPRPPTTTPPPPPPRPPSSLPETSPTRARSRSRARRRSASSLSRSAAGWSPGPDSRAYQWRRCDAAGGNCADIAGATGTSYVLVGADFGQTIRVVETATKTAYNDATSTSVQTAVVAPGTITNTGVPTVSGTPTVTLTLTATGGQLDARRDELRVPVGALQRRRDGLRRPLRRDRLDVRPRRGRRRQEAEGARDGVEDGPHGRLRRLRAHRRDRRRGPDAADEHDHARRRRRRVPRGHDALLPPRRGRFVHALERRRRRRLGPGLRELPERWPGGLDARLRVRDDAGGRPLRLEHVLLDGRCGRDVPVRRHGG